MRRKKTVQDYHRLAELLGFKWVGKTLPKKVSIKTKWECQEGHQWEARYNGIQQGNSCPYCSGHVPKNSEDYCGLARGRDFKWAGKEIPKDTSTKTFWECSKEHKWETTFQTIQRGSGCPYCAGVVPKTPEDYYAIAKNREFEWMGRVLPRNVSVKTLWKCQEGHEWEAPYSSLQSGRGCPHCYGHLPLTAEDYCGLAKERGLEWLGKELPKNAHAKAPWRCQEGHEWEACYASIRHAESGCPYCWNHLPLVSKDYHKLAQERGFEWVGETHPPNSKTKTCWKCSQGHVWKATYGKIYMGRGCPHCFRKSIKDYHNLASERGFKWIGKELPQNTNAKTRWRCSEGHEWETDYGHVQRGTGCPYCCNNVPKTTRDYYDLASNKGFEWMGGEFPLNTSAKTLWQCSKGHEWKTTYGAIRQGSGCPHCLDLINGAQVSKSQRELHKIMGGILNYPCDPYNIDIALLDKMIAIEYDSWFWHGHKQEYDAERDRDLLAAGWKVLHIKTNVGLPSKWELDEAIAKLEDGKRQVEIVLGDWGKGPTFAEVRAQKKIDPWEKGPMPIDFDGGITFTEVQQLGLW